MGKSTTDYPAIELIVIEFLSINNKPVTISGIMRGLKHKLPATFTQGRLQFLLNDMLKRERLRYWRIGNASSKKTYVLSEKFPDFGLSYYDDESSYREQQKAKSSREYEPTFSEIF